MNEDLQHIAREKLERYRRETALRNILRKPWRKKTLHQFAHGLEPQPKVGRQAQVG